MHFPVDLCDFLDTSGLLIFQYQKLLMLPMKKFVFFFFLRFLNLRLDNFPDNHVFRLCETTYNHSILNLVMNLHIFIISKSSLFNAEQERFNLLSQKLFHTKGKTSSFCLPVSLGSIVSLLTLGDKTT